MDIRSAQSETQWDAFLASATYRPFLQSWTMGEVYRKTGQEPLRLEAYDGNRLVGVCQAIVVEARRGKHLSIPYGPIAQPEHESNVTDAFLTALSDEAQKRNCSFIRLSPFRKHGSNMPKNTIRSPLHLLAEHIWYVPLKEPDAWEHADQGSPVTEEKLLSDMRKTTRNLIRRAEKDGVTIERSQDPIADLEHFITLHEETRKRHAFTPYTNAFFRAQVESFAPSGECSLYKAMYEGEVIATSIHMHVFGETSYHHGASTQKHAKIPASYALQWQAMRDALERGDHVYNFWGVSPEGATKHPFAGVRTFKTGFGGKLLELMPCMDLPVSNHYYLTRAFETVRKWQRGF